MCSATTTKKTEDLVKVALKKEPIYIGIEEKSQVILTSIWMLGSSFYCQAPCLHKNISEQVFVASY